MAFVVEDGTGLADANSYASVAEADSYHADNGAPAAWTAATTAAKQAGLVQATQFVDNVMRKRWKGVRSDYEQALAWPRFAAYDFDEVLIANNVVPARLKQCTSVLALKALSETLMTDQAAPGTVQRERSKAGPVEYEVEYSGGASQQKRYASALALISDLVVDSNVADRG